MKIIVTVVLLFTVLLPASGFAGSNIRTVSVTGESESSHKAEKAIVYISVTKTSKSLIGSHTQLIKALDALTADIIKTGLTASDIKRSLISQGESYKWVKNTQVKDGYYSDCRVELHVNAIENMGGVYKALSGYKSVTVNYTEFKRDDEDDLRTAEYKKALLKAKDKAAMMAETLGARLGKVYAIAEAGAVSVHEVSIGLKRENRSVAKSSPAAASYGNITINASVSVVYEIK